MIVRDTSTKRVFAGLPLPEPTTRELHRWIATWQDTYGDWKPARSKILHITLHFFGDTAIAEVERLVELMDKLHGSPIRASMAEVECFPKKGAPRVLFVGIREGLEELRALYRTFHELIRTLGYREDKRGFIPHITIARKRYGGGRRRGPSVEKARSPHGRGAEIGSGNLDFLALPPETEESFTLDRLILFESILKPQGAEYIPLKQVTLQ